MQTKVYYQSNKNRTVMEEGMVRSLFGTKKWLPFLTLKRALNHCFSSKNQNFIKISNNVSTY